RIPSKSIVNICYTNFVRAAHWHEPRLPVFPYTTLFRSPGPLATQSDGSAVRRRAVARGHAQGHDPRAHRERRDGGRRRAVEPHLDRKSTRLNSSHLGNSYAVFCLKKKKINFDICTLSLL